MLKKGYMVCLLLLYLHHPGQSFGQTLGGRPHLFQVSLDNDFINLHGKPTDKAYTNGLSLEYYFQKDSTEKRGLKFLPAAGKEALNTIGWSITQAMYSPKDMRRRFPDPADFSYSGGLFVSHSLHSSDPKKKRSVRSHLLLGIMGPPSLAEATQKLVHRTMGFITPRGWAHQLKTDLLINAGLGVEKMITSLKGGAEMIAGAEAHLGSLYSTISVYNTFRAGRQLPYFNSFWAGKNIGNNKNKLLFSLVFTPKAEVLFYNALVNGGLFRRWFNKPSGGTKQDMQVRPVIFCELNYGANITWKQITLSVMQTRFLPTSNNITSHEFGNISMAMFF